MVSDLHLMRPTAASLMLDAGVTVDRVIDQLGDDPQTVWRHYRHRVRALSTGRAHQVTNPGMTSATFLVLHGFGEYGFIASD